VEEMNDESRREDGGRVEIDINKGLIRISNILNNGRKNDG
jgi:hypothetical protein